MKQLYISFLLLCVANSKLLSDTSSRLNKPVKLQREPKPENKENVNKRSKRSYDNVEHGSDWDSKITVTKVCKLNVILLNFNSCFMILVGFSNIYLVGHTVSKYTKFRLKSS